MTKITTHNPIPRRREPQSLAVLDDRVTPAPQIKVDILALVDAHLARHHHHHAVAHPRDVRRPVHVARDDEAAGNVPERQRRERHAPVPVGVAPGGSPAPRRHRHVDDAPVNVGQGAGRGRARRRGRQQDVHAAVVADDDVARLREARLPDRLARPLDLAVVVLGCARERRDAVVALLAGLAFGACCWCIGREGDKEAWVATGVGGGGS